MGGITARPTLKKNKKNFKKSIDKSEKLWYNKYVIKREKEVITMARTVYYFDMDGVLCNFHKEP